MATLLDSPLVFFAKATPEQFAYVLGQYRKIFDMHAQETRGAKKNGPAELIKLDNWFQESLPQIIKSRKDQQLVYDEVVQITKWKLLRGKFRPSILDLVRTNTETAIKNVTKKAFKKMPNINAAITALTQLKGIAPATASAILVAHSPNLCPYMAEENMAATPGVEESELTISEYLNYVEQTNICVERLRAQDPKTGWTPHKVELAMWTLYQAKQHNSNLLDDMPMPVKLGKPVNEETDSNSKLDDDEQEDRHDEGVNSNESDDNSNQSIEQAESEELMNGNAESKANGSLHLNGNGLHYQDESNLSAASVLSSENEDKSNDSLLNKETVTSSTVDSNHSADLPVAVEQPDEAESNQQPDFVESTSSVQSTNEAMEVVISNESVKIENNHHLTNNQSQITSNHNVEQINDNATDQPDKPDSQPDHTEHTTQHNHCNGTLKNSISDMFNEKNNKESLKENLISSSEENSNNNLSEEYSNLSGSNLSYADLHSTTDNAIDDGPALKRIRVE